MRTRSVLMILVLGLAMVVMASPTKVDASVAGEYPEFPYAATAYTEPYRGQFHFSSRGGWMNDINAPLYHNGVYHVFYQHNPHGLQWDTMHWGHATSPDLLHWTQQPIALEPGVHPGNLFSGGGVVDANNTSGLGIGAEGPIVVFTGTDGVSVAYSNDGARTFQPYDGGRQVFTMPANSRDPKVLWHAPTNRWVMVVWSDAGGNAAHIYTSPNLLDWAFRSRYAADWLFECPDLFPLQVDGSGATRWVLADAQGEYVVGDFDGTTFTTDWTAPQAMDRGDTGFTGSFYAGLTFSNMPDGRTVQMAWMPGNRGSTWTGNATFPTELRLRSRPEGPRLTRTPVAEIDALRTGSQSWTARTVTADTTTDPLAGVTADTYEISAEFDVTASTADRFGLRLHTRADGTHDRVVVYDRARRTLDGVPLDPVDGRIRMRLLVDRGQLEIFGNDGSLSITDNVDFDPSPASQGIGLHTDGGSARLVSLQLHRLRSTWGHGEPTLATNVAGPWRAVHGSWTDVAGGKQGSATGDAFYLSGRTGADFTYEADVRLDTAVAAAVTFRADADATQHYTVNVDADGMVKLWRPGRDIATYSTPIVRGRTYHLKVVAAGSRIRVHLDHRAAPVIDVVDGTYAGGYFGINVYNGTGVVQNVNVDAIGWRTDLGNGWQPAAGVWTVPGAGVQGRRTGDGFLLANSNGADFTYQADLCVVTGRAAGLTFRANADATAHYTANIDTDGLVKLWRPGRDIATFPTPVVPGRAYHLKVVAVGPRIRVYLDGRSTPVIDAVDSTYAAGRFGVNVFDGVARVQDVDVD